MQTSETHDTRALVERLFAAYERGDSQQLFDHVAGDVHWTITGNNPLSGEYRSKREFLDTTYERLAAILKEPVRPACGESSPRATWSSWNGTVTPQASSTNPMTTTIAGSSA